MMAAKAARVQLLKELDEKTSDVSNLAQTRVSDRPRLMRRGPQSPPRQSILRTPADYPLVGWRLWVSVAFA
jgi:hypothetical protein